MSIVLPNHLFIQFLAVFLDHIEKLLDKCIIEIFSCDLSYDQIKNLVLRRDTRYVYPQFLNGIYFLDQRRSCNHHYLLKSMFTVTLDLHKYVGTKVVTRLLLQICSVYLYSLDWFVVKPSEIGMKDGISHLSAGVLVFSFQLAITPPPETVIGQCIATAQSY